MPKTIDTRKRIEVKWVRRASIAYEQENHNYRGAYAKASRSAAFHAGARYAQRWVNENVKFTLTKREKQIIEKGLIACRCNRRGCSGTLDASAMDSLLMELVSAD